GRADDVPILDGDELRELARRVGGVGEVKILDDPPQLDAAQELDARIEDVLWPELAPDHLVDGAADGAEGAGEAADVQVRRDEAARFVCRAKVQRAVADDFGEYLRRVADAIAAGCRVRALPFDGRRSRLADEVLNRRNIDLRLGHAGPEVRRLRRLVLGVEADRARLQ